MFFQDIGVVEYMWHMQSPSQARLHRSARANDYTRNYTVSGSRSKTNCFQLNNEKCASFSMRSAGASWPRYHILSIDGSEISQAARFRSAELVTESARLLVSYTPLHASQLLQIFRGNQSHGET